MASNPFPNPDFFVAPGARPAWVAWVLALAATHLCNLLADRESDWVNRKNCFWMKHITDRQLARVATTLAAGSVVLGAVAGGIWLLPILATLLLGALYSLPPFRLSGRWGWDALANGLGYGVIAPWMGILTTDSGHAAHEPGGLSILLGDAAMYLLPLVVAAFLLTTILDRSGDRRVDKITCAVRFGEAGTLLAAIGILIAAAATARFLPIGQGWADGNSWLPTPWQLSLLAAVLAAAAIPPSSSRRSFVIGAIVAAVLAAGQPGLQRWPATAIPMSIWLLGGYLLLWLAGRIGGVGRDH